MSELPIIDPLRAEKLRFKATKEAWNEWKLDNGTTIFGRLLLYGILRSDKYGPTGEPIYIWNTSRQFYTVSPKEIRGKPSETLPPSIKPEDFASTEVVDFERVGEEGWSIYNLSDGSVFRIKVELVSAVKTDAFLPDAEPYYLLYSNETARVRTEPKLIQRKIPVAKTQLGVYH